MTARTGFATLLVVLAVVVATASAGALPAMSAAGTASAQDGGGNASYASQDGGGNASNASNATLGASISGFMQSSAADTEGEVDDGMFSARFDNTSQEQRADLVQNRAGTLEQRLDRLREQRAELLNTTDGETPSVADRAKAARLTARIDALQDSINTTSEAAARAGVDVQRLDELRRNASNLTGQEVAELARGLAGTERGPPGLSDGDRGHATDRGPAADRGDNGSDGNTTDEAPRGQKDFRGDGDGNATDRGDGKPDDAGNGSGGAAGSSDDSDDRAASEGNKSGSDASA